MLKRWAWLAAIPLAAAFAWLWRNEAQHQAARRRDDLAAAAVARIQWTAALPPGTPVRADTPFGRFTLPLDHMASRDEFLPDATPKSPEAGSDGYHRWTSFSAAFWMPDGGGVNADPAQLLAHWTIEPVTLAARPTPLRPRESGRPDPDASHYVAVVGEFCPLAGPASTGAWQGGDLLLSGYGGGAYFMYPCGRAEAPIEGWSPVDVAAPGRFWCHDGDAWPCFGWIDLPSQGVRALTYLPADALGQVPQVAARLDTLMASWRRESAVHSP